MRLYPRLERKGEALASRQAFWGRIGVSLLWVAALLLPFLLAGAVYFHRVEDTSWPEAVHRAAVFVSGFGHLGLEPKSFWWSVFLVVYSLGLAFVLIVVIGLILTPILHRVLHHFHLDDEDEKGAAPKRPAKPRPRAKRAGPRTS